MADEGYAREALQQRSWSGGSIRQEEHPSVVETQHQTSGSRIKPPKNTGAFTTDESYTVTCQPEVRDAIPKPPNRDVTHETIQGNDGVISGKMTVW